LDHFIIKRTEKELEQIKNTLEEIKKIENLKRFADDESIKNAWIKELDSLKINQIILPTYNGNILMIKKVDAETFEIMGNNIPAEFIKYDIKDGKISKENLLKFNIENKEKIDYEWRNKEKTEEEKKTTEKEDQKKE